MNDALGLAVTPQEARDALVVAAIAIAILIAGWLLWRLYKPRAARGLRRVNPTTAAINVLAWLAGIALVLAAVYLVTSSAHGSWLAVVAGFGVGIALLFVGETLASRYGVTAEAIDGAGIGILYVTCYAMHVQWNLAPLTVAIIGMLLVTTVAAFLSMRRRSFFIAILGLIGGFAAPALLSFTDRPVALFTYLLVLNITLSWIAYRMRWPLLIAVSVARTALYEWTWVLQSLTVGQLRLATAIFAAFAIVAAVPFWSRPWDRYPRRFRWIAAMAVLLPLLFAFYMAANANYGQKVNILFGFLLVIAMTLTAIVWRGGPERLHIAGGIATLLTFVIWFWQWGVEWYGPDSWPPQPVRGLVLTVAVWVGLFIALYLVRKTTPFAALLFFVFIGLGIREPQDSTTVIVAMVGMLLAVLVTFIRRGDASLGAIAIGLSAIALMVLNPLSPLYLMRVSHALAPPPVPWFVLAAFAILFAALFTLASILDRPLFAAAAVLFYLGMLVTAYAPSTLEQLLVAAVPYTLFAGYAIRERARAAVEPYVALVLASLVFCVSAASTLTAAGREYGLGAFAGAVPLFVAALLLLFARHFWAERREPHLTLLLSAAMVFFNAAIVMLLPVPWAVIVLAVEAFVLILLFVRDGYSLFRFASVALAVALFVWITIDARTYTFDPGYHRYLDGYPKVELTIESIVGFVLVLCAVAICAGAMLYAGGRVVPRDMPRTGLLFSLAGLVESWYLVNIIIANAFHSSGATFNVDFMNFGPREDVTYTIAWAVIATILLFAGVTRDWQGARVGATGLLILAIAKCFLHDLVRRDDPYRVASLVTVAVSLIAVGIILQRYSDKRVAAGSAPAAT